MTSLSSPFLLFRFIWILAALWSKCSFGMAQSAKIYGSELSFELNIGGKNKLYQANELFDLENILGKFLSDALETDTVILHLGVAIQNQSLELENAIRVDALLSLVYWAKEPINLSQLLETNVEISKVAAQLQAENVLVLYDQVVGTTDLLAVPENQGNKLGDTGLLAATACLSATVLVIASILLYVTGGWTACRKCLCRICYHEEVIEEEKIEQKETFPENNEPHDEESRSIAESSVAGTAASGILGAMGNDENSNPTLNLGIKTPTRRHLQDGESNITGVSEQDEDSEMCTPQSEMSNRSISTAALGITSMRKLLHTTADETTQSHDDSSKQSGSLEPGLSYMIMDRFKDKK